MDIETKLHNFKEKYSWMRDTELSVFFKNKLIRAKFELRDAGWQRVLLSEKRGVWFDPSVVDATNVVHICVLHPEIKFGVRQ